MDTPVHGRLRIGGTLFGDANWSIGLAVSTPTEQDPFAQVTLDVQAELEAWADRVRADNSNGIFPPFISGMLSEQGKVTYIRTARVNAAGRETAVALLTLGQPVAGSGTPDKPAQTSVVASLLSALPGAANRGRIYWPALRVPLSATGRAATTFNAELAAATATWAAAAAENLAPGLNQQVVNVPAVVSRSTGTLRRVQTVRVGNRLDSQRRRAEGQQEAYASSAVPQQ